MKKRKDWILSKCQKVYLGIMGGLCALCMSNGMIHADIVGTTTAKSNEWIEVIQGIAAPVALFMLAVAFIMLIIGQKKAATGIVITTGLGYILLMSIMDVFVLISN